MIQMAKRVIKGLKKSISSVNIDFLIDLDEIVWVTSISDLKVYCTPEPEVTSIPKHVVFQNMHHS